MDFLVNTKESRENVIRYISRLPIEKSPYKVRILKVNKDRSGEQNRYMWYVFSLLAMEFKTDRNTIHDFFTQVFLKVTDKVGNHEFERVRGTSTLTTTEHAWFMDQVRIWVSLKHGIIVPLPGEIPSNEL